LKDRVPENPSPDVKTQEHDDASHPYPATGRRREAMMRDFLKQYPRVEQLARQLMALYPASPRLGSGFWQHYALLQESEAWSEAQLREFQFDKLRTLLRRLAATSPFYARRLAGVPIEQLDTLAKFQSLVPSLTRQEFAANYAEIRSRDFNPRQAVACSTSGTTGNALQFHHPRGYRQREWAAICHQWRRVGYDPVRSHRAEFRALTRAGALYDEFPEQRMVRFSILDLRAENLPRMADMVTSRGLRFFHGYPSAMYLLAREVVRSGFRFPQPQAFLLASEVVYDFQLEQIQAAFPESRLFAHYGCAEATVLSAWCEHRRVYHVLPQYALTEVDATTGEISGTNLYNDLNGFVRYRMTDAAGGVENTPCPACHRPYTPILTRLDGRQEDYLYSRDRGWIAPAIVTYPLKHLHAIQELQFLQENPDTITINYVVRPGATREAAAHELQEVEGGLYKLLGTRTRLVARPVDDIPRGATGKYKWIVSRLDPRSAEASGQCH